MEFAQYTTLQLHELVTTLMRYKFGLRASQEMYSDMVNEVLKGVKKHVEECREETAVKESLLLVFTHEAPDERIELILEDMRSCPEFLEMKKGDLIEMFHNAIWPMRVAVTQEKKVWEQIKNMIG